MGKRTTFFGFVAWYFGSVLASLALLVGLLALWSWKWHRANDAEVRANAAYWERQVALEDAWRLKKPAKAVRVAPDARTGRGGATTAASDGILKVQRFSKCGTASCTYDIRDHAEVL